jgi:hypothetical protein
MPARADHTAGIRATGKGFVITEPAFEAEKGNESLNYNNFGMAFRIKAGPGAYDTLVAVSGMQTSRLLPNQTRMHVDGREWRYNFVNGQPFIDIEVEPKKSGVPSCRRRLRLATPP